MWYATWVLHINPLSDMSLVAAKVTIRLNLVWLSLLGPEGDLPGLARAYAQRTPTLRHLRLGTSRGPWAHPIERRGQVSKQTAVY